MNTTARHQQAPSARRGEPDRSDGGVGMIAMATQQKDCLVSIVCAALFWSGIGLSALPSSCHFLRCIDADGVSHRSPLGFV